MCTRTWAVRRNCPRRQPYAGGGARATLMLPRFAAARAYLPLSAVLASLRGGMETTT